MAIDLNNLSGLIAAASSIGELVGLAAKIAAQLRSLGKPAKNAPTGAALTLEPSEAWQSAIAFVEGSDNAAFLTDLLNHVADRVRNLGGSALWHNAERATPAPLAAPRREPEPEEEEAAAIPEQVAPLPLAPQVSLFEALGKVKDEPPEDALPLSSRGKEKGMPDYSKFPEELRLKLEAGWKAQNP